MKARQTILYQPTLLLLSPAYLRAYQNELNILEKRRNNKLMKAIQKEEKNKARQVDESNPKRRAKEQKESEIL